MIDLETFLQHAERGSSFTVGWNDPRWAAAFPLLQWLGTHSATYLASRVPERLASSARERLTPQEVKPACDRMARSFWDGGGELRWSGGQVHSALSVVAEAVGGAPEPFLFSLWAELGRRELTEQTYQLCREVGRATLGSFRRCADWDLVWLTGAALPAQACLRYWTIGVKPELWTAALEEQTTVVLAPYPFKF